MPSCLEATSVTVSCAERIDTYHYGRVVRSVPAQS